MSAAVETEEEENGAMRRAGGFFFITYPETWMGGALYPSISLLFTDTHLTSGGVCVCVCY